MALLEQSSYDKIMRVAMRLQNKYSVYGSGLNKPDLMAAIQSADAWINTNEAAFNTALPTQYRTLSNIGEKYGLFSLVVLERAGVFDTVMKSLADLA